jgi:hypothetical protein
MDKTLTKATLLEKLETFRTKIKYYQDTLIKGTDDLLKSPNGISKNHIIKTTAILRQNLRKTWGSLERYYINMGLPVEFLNNADSTNKTDIFYHSLSENFFHDPTVIQTLEKTLEVTDIAIGKCEATHPKEIFKLAKKPQKNSSAKIKILYSATSLVVGFLIGNYLNITTFPIFIKAIFGN